MPVASSMVGMMSMTWANCVRISPWALMRFGQEMAIAFFVPPKCEAICLVHWNGVSMAWAQPIG